MCECIADLGIDPCDPMYGGEFTTNIYGNCPIIETVSDDDTSTVT